ncbi:MAG: TAXI family TRAP transporter solute-binding subunit [Stellaceae bacterium]
MRRACAAVSGAVLLLLSALPGRAADVPPTIIVHAGKADSLNHALALQFAEALAQGNNALTVQVEESQGSVQNIMDALRRGGHYVFTAPPNLIVQAKRGDKPFEKNPRYRDIRALFPVPALTLHWAVRADSGITRLPELAGKSLVPGSKGSFGERQTVSALHALGLDQRVQLIDIDPAGAQAALAGRQVAGVALAGTVPLPAVRDLAKAVPIRLLSLTHAELARVLAADDSTVAETIPKGTYPGQSEDVTSIALPAGVYATTAMSDKMAYAITKAFWSQKWALGQRNPPWNSVSPASLAQLGIKLHKGAERYYKEAGIKLPAALR